MGHSSSLHAMRMHVEQLRQEASMNRMSVSEALKE